MRLQIAASRFRSAHGPARQRDGLFTRWRRLDELAVKLGSPRPEIAPSRRIGDFFRGQERDHHVIAQRLALGQHLTKRVDNHRQARLDGIVVGADGVAEDAVDSVFPGRAGSHRMSQPRPFGP